MKKRKAIFSLESVILGGFLFVVGIVLYSMQLRDSSVPATLRYIAPNASSFFVSSALGKLWDVSSHHVGSLLQGNKTSLGKETEFRNTIAGLRSSLEDSCLGLYSESSLRAIGLDTGRGITMATFGPESFDKPGTFEGSILVLPIIDKSRFIRTVTSLSNGQDVVLESVDKLRPATSFRVTHKHLRQGRLCGMKRESDIDRGHVVEVLNEELFTASDQGDLILRYIPDQTVDAVLNLRCTAIFEDGSEGGCRCNIDGEDCSKKVTFEKGTIKKNPVILDDQRDILIFDQLVLVFPDEKNVIIGSNMGVIKAALHNTRRNLEFYRNWDSLINDFGSIAGDLAQSEALIIGAVRGPGKPLTTYIPVALSIGPDQLRISATLDFRNWGMKLLDLLVRTSGMARSDSVMVPLGSGASIILSDKYLSYYLTFMFDYVKGASDLLNTQLGNFQIVLEEMAKSSSVKSVGLFLLGMTDGVPQLVMAVRSNEEEAGNILFRLQKRLRIARDQTILEMALGKYKEDHGKEQEITINGLLQKNSLQQNRESYIVSEAESFWDYFNIIDNETIVHTKGIKASSFMGVTYKTGPETDDSGHVRPSAEDNFFKDRYYNNEKSLNDPVYIMPPFTENDLKYRYNKSELDELDVKALVRGDFRMPAVYINDEHMMLIASNVNTMNKILFNKNYALTVPVDKDVERISIQSNPKLSIFLDPEWIINQGLLHPDNKLVERTENYIIELEQYQSILISLQPRAEQNGILFSTIFVKK